MATNTSTPDVAAKGTRARVRGIRGWLPALCLAAGFAAIDVVPLAAADVDEVRTALSPQDTREPLGAAEQAKLRWQPLSAKILNAVLVARSGVSYTAGPKEGWALLERLGFRSTEAQTNLLFRAAARDDREAVLAHADALMRRGKQTEQAFAFLATLEKASGGPRTVFPLLAADPPWRERYLAAGALIDSALLANRTETLERLGERDLAGRAAIAVAMQIAADQQRGAEFARLARLAGRSGGAGGAPRFAWSEDAVLPSEWSFPQSREIQSYAADNGEAGVGFEYSPPGAQVLARRLLRAADAGRTLAFRIKGDAPAPLLTLALGCPGKIALIGSSLGDRMTAAVPATLPCAVPRIELRTLGASGAARFTIAQEQGP